MYPTPWKYRKEFFSVHPDPNSNHIIFDACGKVVLERREFDGSNREQEAEKTFSFIVQAVNQFERVS